MVDISKYEKKMAQLLAVGALGAGLYAYAATPRAPAEVGDNEPERHASAAYSKDQQPFFTTDPKDALPIRYAKSGIGSKEETPAQTITSLFQKACERHADTIAFRVERPIKPLAKGETAPPAFPLDEWTTWTYKQYYESCEQLAKSYIKIGLQPHESVAVYGFNSPEWIMGEIAAIMSGGIGVGIYPTDTIEQLTFKLKHSNCVVAICGDEEKFKRVSAAAPECPELKAIVCYDYMCSGTIDGHGGKKIPLYSFKQFMNLGKEIPDSVLQERIENQNPGHCCVLIYTSGTTGNPKAVMISHDNIVFEAAAALHEMDFIGNGDEEESLLSYLPLTHVAGMMVDIVLPLQVTALRPKGVTVSFARTYDLKAGTIKDRLVAVKPTVFLGVPRVWEKIAEKMKAIGAKITGVKKKLSTWAKAKGLEHQRNCQLGGNGEYPPFYGIADKIVLTNVKKGLGLEKCKFGFTGAAPIAIDTLEYFGSLGIQINEVYGMSECSGSATWSTDYRHVWGSCGYSLPGVEIKIFKKDDNGKMVECPLAKDITSPTDDEQGEICYRGRNIMMGYMANAKLGEEHVATILKKTKGAIDDDGWLHSEDRGCMDTKGFIKVTGRYKELIIGAGGENIAPVPLEDNIKQVHQGVSNVMMVGDKRKFNVCLITLKTVGATGEKPGTDDLDGGALGINPAVTKVSQAVKDETFIKSIEKAIRETNSNGKCCPINAAKIQKFTILPSDFSVETEELTPTLKLKRSVVEKKHAKMISKLYESQDVYVPYTA